MPKKQHKKRDDYQPPASQIPKAARTMPPSQRLAYADEALDAVRHALEDFNTAPNMSRKRTAIRNFVEQGRSVTWILEQLKSSFGDQWSNLWEPIVAQLRADQVAAYFYDLRNPIIKEGELQVAADFNVSHLEVKPDDYPTGAVGFAVGREGPVWVMADSTERPVATTPGQMSYHRVTIVGMPEDLASQNLALLMQRHLATLEHIVNTVRAHVATPQPGIDLG